MRSMVEGVCAALIQQFSQALCLARSRFDEKEGALQSPLPRPSGGPPPPLRGGG
jgi:hypothetical protein